MDFWASANVAFISSMTNRSLPLYEVLAVSISFKSSLSFSHWSQDSEPHDWKLSKSG